MKRKTKKPSRPRNVKTKKGGSKGDAETVEEESTASGDANVESLTADLQSAEDRYLRLYAEFENYRRRTREDLNSARLSGVAEFVEKLAPILHDLERAVDACEAEKDREAIIDGLRLVGAAFGELLGRFGIDVFDPSGGTFDEQFMEAFGMIPSESVPAGRIVQVVEKGYRMGERLIRPARVLVSSGPPKEAAAANDEVENGNRSATHAGDVDEP